MVVTLMMYKLPRDGFMPSRTALGDGEAARHLPG